MEKKTQDLLLLAGAAGLGYYLYTQYNLNQTSKNITPYNIHNEVVNNNEENGEDNTTTTTTTTSSTQNEIQSEPFTTKPISLEDSKNKRIYWVHKRWNLNREDSEAVVNKADFIVSDPYTEWAQSIQAKANERGNSFYQQAINDAYWILFGVGSQASMTYTPGTSSTSNNGGNESTEQNNGNNTGNPGGTTGSGYNFYYDYEDDYMSSGDWMMIGINGKTFIDSDRL